MRSMTPGMPAGLPKVLLVCCLPAIKHVKRSHDADFTTNVRLPRAQEFRTQGEQLTVTYTAMFNENPGISTPRSTLVSHELTIIDGLSYIRHLMHSNAAHRSKRGSLLLLVQKMKAT